MNICLAIYQQEKTDTGKTSFKMNRNFSPGPGAAESVITLPLNDYCFLTHWETLSSRITYYLKLCCLKLCQWEKTSPSCLDDLSKSLWQRSSLNLQLRCRASDKGFLGTVVHSCAAYLCFSKRKGTLSSPHSPDLMLISLHIVLLWFEPTHLNVT